VQSRTTPITIIKILVAKILVVYYRPLSGYLSDSQELSYEYLYALLASNPGRLTCASRLQVECWNIRSQDYSFPGTFVPGPFVPQYRILRGKFIP